MLLAMATMAHAHDWEDHVMSISLLLRIAALVCFIIATLGMPAIGGVVALLPLGLVLLLASAWTSEAMAALSRAFARWGAR